MYFIVIVIGKKLLFNRKQVRVFSIFEQCEGYNVAVLLLFHDVFEKKLRKDIIFLKTGEVTTPPVFHLNLRFQTKPMETIISILRGINLGSHNKIPMPELKTLYEKAGFKNVATYIQSGNVVFSADKPDLHSLPDKIQQLIFKKYKFNVPVIVRTVDEMQSVVDNNPMLKNKSMDIEKLHVTFLSDKPQKEHLEKMAAYQYKPDEYIIGGKEIFVFCPNGYGNTKLSNNFFESKLKVTATTRNWRTVNELLRIGLG